MKNLGQDRPLLQSFHRRRALRSIRSTILPPLQTDGLCGKKGGERISAPTPGIDARSDAVNRRQDGHTPSVEEKKNEERRECIHNMHAAEALVHAVKENPGEYTLLALGPLTNVAIAITLCPEFLSLFRRVVIMGGDAECRGNATFAAEFNFYADPEAAHLVLNAAQRCDLVGSCDVVMVGWSICLRASMVRGNITSSLLKKSTHSNIISIDSHVHVCKREDITIRLHTYNQTYNQTYIHTYIHTYMHTYIQPNIHIYVFKYIHTYIVYITP